MWNCIAHTLTILTCNPLGVFIVDNVTTLQADALGLEAFNIKASVKAMKELLPNFVNSVTEFYNTILVTKNEPAIGLVKAGKLEKVLKDVDYAAVRKMQVYGPKGIKGTYIDYLDAVEGAVKHAEDLKDKVLGPFMNWVTLLLATPENLQSVRQHPLVGKDKLTELDKIRDTLTKQVDPLSNQQKHLYSKLVTRNKDWSVIIDRTNELSNRFSSTDRKAILQMVEDTTDALNRLIVRIEEDPETYKMSGTTIATLASQSFALGKELEHYSATGYLVQELVSVVTDTVSQLEKTFVGGK